MENKAQFGTVSAYDILGLNTTATQQEVKTAYRKLAAQHHPDVNSSPEAASRFRLISAAYELLKHPASRQRYDRWLSRSSSAAEHPAIARARRTNHGRAYAKPRHRALTPRQAMPLVVVLVVIVAAVVLAFQLRKAPPAPADILRLSYRGYEQWPLTAKAMQRVRVLVLSHNEISALPAEVKRCTQLMDLRADHNRLSSVPAELFSLPLLTRLDLSDNRLTKLPPLPEHLAPLVWIDVRGNPLPTETLQRLRKAWPQAEVLADAPAAAAPLTMHRPTGMAMLAP